MTYTEAIIISKTLPVLEGMVCALLCAKEVYKEAVWVVWADRWIRCEDRSEAAAIAAAPGCRSLMHKSKTIPSAYAAWNTTQAAICMQHKSEASTNIERANTWANIASQGVLAKVLTDYFLCPYCRHVSSAHTSAGKCLFGTHVWEGINKAFVY